MQQSVESGSCNRRIPTDQPPVVAGGGGAKFGPDGSSIIGSLSGNPEQLFFIVDSRQRTECRMRTNRVVGFLSNE